MYGRNLISRDVDNQNLVFAYNGHGDVVSLADSTGVLVEYTYDEFGNLISEDFAENITDVNNPYRYAGYEYLDEVELYDLKARYYDPDTARFLSADPYFDLGNRVMGLYEINVPNVNSIMQANALYAYCKNSPILCADFNGLRTYIFNGINNEKEKGAPDYIEDFASLLEKRGVDNVKTVGIYNGTNTLTGLIEVTFEIYYYNRASTCFL